MMLLSNVFSPIKYDLCNQTVTIYHRDGEKYTRNVHYKAFLDYRKTETTSKTGSQEANSFLLIIPGDQMSVLVGDKVIQGIGPECSTREQWSELIPAKVQGLVIVQYVDPKYWNGKIVHIEAGG